VTSSRGSGRARSERSRTAILESAAALLAEEGYARLSFDRIATRARVGKQTVYRWWPSTSALVAECMSAGYLPAGMPLTFAGDDIVSDIAAWLADLSQRFSDERRSRSFRGLIAASAEDESVGEALYERFTAAQRSSLVDRLELAKSRGELPPDCSTTILGDSLIGGIIYRMLTRKSVADAHFDDLVALVVAARSSPARATSTEGLSLSRHQSLGPEVLSRRPASSPEMRGG
jgi:AcrR family transcriptional regulator